jgi:hypothetical protein
MLKLAACANDKLQNQYDASIVTTVEDSGPDSWEHQYSQAPSCYSEPRVGGSLIRLACAHPSAQSCSAAETSAYSKLAYSDASHHSLALPASLALTANGCC